MLTMWVVYNSPKDFPGLYVARKWVKNAPTSELVSAESLDEVRKQIPQGLMRVPRDTRDDPVIVETWI